MASCNFTHHDNRYFMFPAGWKAIPETIVLNLIVFLFFLVIFILLRKAAWNRKNLNLNQTSKGWLQSIYGDRHLATKNYVEREDSPIIHHKHDLQINPLLPPIKLAGSLNPNNYKSHPFTTPHVNGNYTRVPGEPQATDITLEKDEHSSATTTQQSGNTSIDDNITKLTETPRNSNSFSYSVENGVETPNGLNVIMDESIREEDRQGPLSTSFDFVTSIPANLQATFTEVGYKLSDVLLISNNDILISRGSDALQYLLFQQYIIYFLAILTAFCTLVILPINLSGDKYRPDSSPYARTTISNLSEKQLGYYYVHVFGSVFITLAGVYTMNRFSRVIKVDDEKITRRTLLIRRIPKSKRNKELIANYFEKLIPNCVIEGIQSVYDIRNLVPITDELTNLINARCYCLQHKHLKGKDLKVRPTAGGEFGCLCSCFSGCKKVDGLEYYSKQEDLLQKEINKQYWKSLSTPTGAFFITFQTEEMAQKAFIHLKRKQERALSNCPFSSTFMQLTNMCSKFFSTCENDEMQVSRWIVSYAPYPNDINWCDVSVNLTMQWTRSIIVNILLMAVFVFISTPTVILGVSDNLKLAELFQFLKFILPKDIESKVPQLLSPLILVIAASALPAIVTLACQSIAYVNISAKNHAIMWKVYLFLLFMVIIWPSLGITSVRISLIQMIQGTDFPWNCLFTVDLGSFFVNYTIQAGFIGNIMELMRLPELLVYLWYRAISRSRAEKETASKYVLWDFAIGMRYPRFLLIFAMVVTYSISCPIITLAGLIYMVMKHLIDRYNIYYVYNPSKINSKIHSSAIIFVHIALIMMQIQIFTLTFIIAPYSKIFGTALFAMVVSLLFFAGHFFFYLFRNINHLTYRATRKQATPSREYCACAYLPPVLYELSKSKLTRTPSNNNQNTYMQAHGGSSVVDMTSLAGRDSGGCGSGITGSTIVPSNSNGVITNNGSECGASNQNLLGPAIDTSDAYFLSGGSNGGVIRGPRPKFSHHKTLLSTHKQNIKSRRTASDGQQLFHNNRLAAYEEMQLKRTNSDLENVQNGK